MDILLWHEILEPYELAVKELQVKFRHLIKEHHGKGLYSPIESVSGRVKSVSSILEKNAEKGHCARRDGGAGGGYRGHPHHLPVR